MAYVDLFDKKGTVFRGGRLGGRGEKLPPSANATLSPPSSLLLHHPPPPTCRALMASSARSTGYEWNQVASGSINLGRRRRGQRLEALIEEERGENPAGPQGARVAAPFYMTDPVFRLYQSHQEPSADVEKDEDEDQNENEDEDENENENEDEDEVEEIVPGAVETAAADALSPPQPQPPQSSAANSDDEPVDIDEIDSVWIKPFTSVVINKKEKTAIMTCDIGPCNGNRLRATLSKNGRLLTSNAAAHLKSVHGSGSVAKGQTSVYEKLESFKRTGARDTRCAVEHRTALKDYISNLKAGAAEATKRLNTLTSEGTKPIESFGKVTKEDHVGRAVRDCHQLVMMISGGCSFRFGENVHFREYVKRVAASSTTANGAKNLPSGTRLRTHVLNMLYAAVVRTEVAAFQEADAFSITFDAWTSRSMQHSLLAITYHWCDATFKMHEAVLDSVPLEQSHTAEHLAKEIAKRVHFRSSDRQILYTGVTDNAANVRKACVAVVNRLETLQQGGQLDEEDDDGPLQDELERAIGCVAHSLNLAVGDLLRDLPELKKLVEQMAGVIAAVNRSNQRKLALREFQVKLNLRKEGRTLMLISFIVTRWNSLVRAVDRFVVLYDALIVMFATRCFDNSDEDTVSLPDRIALEELKGLGLVLAPLQDLTTRVQGAKYMTAPHIQNWVAEVVSKIKDVDLPPGRSGMPSLPQRARDCLLRSLRKRTESYFEPDHPFTLAALMHPLRAEETIKRLGTDGQASVEKLVEWSQILHFDLDAVAEKTLMSRKRKREDNEKRLSMLFGDLGDTDPESGSSSGASSSESQSCELTEVEIDDLYAADGEKRRAELRTLFTRLMEEGKTSDVTVEQADARCEAFYSESGNGRSQRALAGLIFSTIGTSGSSERVFSASGLIDSALRSRLSATTLEKLTVIQCYSKKATVADVKKLLTSLEAWLRDPVEQAKLCKLAEVSTFAR